MDKMERLDQAKDGSSMDIVQDNIAKLKQLFPDVFSAGKIDFEKLQETLGDVFEDKEERYNFTWHGKSQAKRIAQTVSTGTLLPCKEESKNWDSTQNLFIEGDNLEVLKLLQKSYHNQVKMIYIDPPYNTGKEFIYPDNYRENLDNYLEYTGQKDSEGRKFGTNADTSGRYHTNWLNMMYPRLKLARNLLRDDGVIFISIDDNEVANLQKLCDEIFGEESFLGAFVVKSTPNARNYGHIAKMHEYCFMYGKDEALTETYEEVEEEKEFTYSDDISGFNIHPLYNSDESFHSKNRPNLYYPFYINKKSNDKGFYHISLSRKNIDDIKVYPPKSVKNSVQFVWRWGKEKASHNLNSEIVGYRMESGEYRIVRKMRHTSKIIRSMFLNKEYSGRRGTAEVEKLFDGKFFSFPKPIDLLKKLLSISTKENDVVLDFFSGSATQAHAVMALNMEDNGNRKYIMVQLPEPCDEKSEAFKAGYKTIADIGKERIRRAGEKILEDNADKEGIKNLDIGFKVFKLASSNIKTWDADFDNLEDTLLSHVDNIKPDRSEDDVLYEILLKYGLNLTVPIEERSIHGKTVYSIGFGALIVCLDDEITLDVVDGIGALKEELEPEVMRVVFKDSGFKDDVVKTNAIQNLKRFGIDDVKSL